jgi:hypothetical protein
MEILSTNKPDIPKKPQAEIEYNDKSYESWVQQGFIDHIPHGISSPHDRIQKFLSQVDTRKAPITRTVRTMIRLRAIDYDTSKLERKEYLYYTEDWHGVNWLGIPITDGGISDHLVGKYQEVLTRPKLDEQTGEHIENVFAGTRDRYYIPFSKTNVDDIIRQSVGTDKNNIRFVVKFSQEDSTDSLQPSSRNYFSYDTFANWSWDRLYDYQYWPTEELMSRPKAGKSATKLEFKPS